jgi:hypothetical protein
VTPRVASRTPSRGGTSFQRFRDESLELTDEEKAFWAYSTLPRMEGEFDAELMLSQGEYRVLSKGTSGGGFLVPTDLAAKVTAASRAASTVAGLATEYLTADGQTFNVALDATLGSAAWLEGLSKPGLTVLLGGDGHELAMVGLRSDGRIQHALADLLSTATGDGDLGSPLQRLLA